MAERIAPHRWPQLISTRVPAGLAPRLPPMSRSHVERRLSEVSTRLKALRDELAVSDEQLAHLADTAEDARLRALVSETPVAEREFHEAQRHADAMARHRAELVAAIERLEATQDELLDRLTAEVKP